MARNDSDPDCLLKGKATLDAVVIYTLAPLVGGFLAGIFEEFHNISITKITNSAIKENDFSQTIAIH